VALKAAERVVVMIAKELVNREIMIRIKIEWQGWRSSRPRRPWTRRRLRQSLDVDVDVDIIDSVISYVVSTTSPSP
jgi:hypothetical protein